ncbi:MAG: NAD-dependent epimerase/dehydratase family protein, partial [Chloroflexota bacterium]
VVAAALAQGMDVVCLDRMPADEPGIRSLIVDLADQGQVYHGIAGCEAILHLGAIPSPIAHSPEVVYRNNVMADFHVFGAAATLGIGRVVHASSVSALGFPFQHRWSEPLYFPIDEAHPLVPQDAYGLSKAAGEDIAAAYCRRGAGSATSLRFSTILGEDSYAAFIAAVHRDPGQSARYLWSYVDLRDAARACILALTTPYSGHHPLFVVAADTTANLHSERLLDRYFPAVPRRIRPRGRQSLIDATRASDLLGFQPQYGWASALGWDEPE